MDDSTLDSGGSAPLGEEPRPGKTRRRRFEVGRTGARFGSPAMRRRLQDEPGVPRGSPTPISEPEPAPVITPALLAEDPELVEDPGQVEDPGDEAHWAEPEEGYCLVRPYAWTKGRTEPAHELAIDTVVSTTAVVSRAALHTLDADQQAVAALCAVPRAVAEVAALLLVPLGVARVLLGDMAERGMIRVHHQVAEAGESPNVEVLQRVLNGLRQL
ncbi:MAG: DUF742 domain-containing protein [Actinomycetota bacterium]|nr:DUF742 domain-containing protein [Actinomycetota bacterium]